MLTQEENELITKTDAGTPMGEFFRRFWLPVMLAEELPGPDCVPVRIRILGEDLIAFRDTLGRVGILDAFCAHRGAPLFFGRNEEAGLRCVYHGWKFDVHGSCVSIPNAPEGPTFKDRVKIKTYPVVDKGGFVWAYMGPAEQMPPLPAFEFMDLPSSHWKAWKIESDCNYLQSLEGAIDTSHASFLHSTLDPQSNPRLRIGIDSDAYVRNAIPRYMRVEETDYGVMGVGIREGAAGDTLVNVTNFVMPSFVPSGSRGRLNLGYLRTRVPIDDQTSAVFRIWWDPDNPLPTEYVSKLQGGEFLVPPMVPGTYRPKANKDNDYMIDRVAQRSYTFTGISSFPLQDVAVIENQRGPIVDRAKETLVSSDSLIIQVRKRLLEAARDMSQGKEPALPHTPELFNVPFTQFRVPRDAPLEDTVQTRLVGLNVVAA